MTAPSSSLTLRLSRGGLPRGVLSLCERLGKAGFRAWVVGGSVRDSLMSQLAGESAPEAWHAKDWDLATDATPEQVKPLFRRVIPTGIEHGTVTVLIDGLSLELTTLRADREYRDGRRPGQIEFVQSIDEDLARRDFTVNALAFEPQTEALIDPFGGLADLEARRLRAVGEAARRFAEDGLRVLRAARLVATLEFELDPDTARAIEPSLDTYRRVSAERIRDEWNKALKARRPSRAFQVMHEHGLLAITAPELEALATRDEKPAPGTLQLALARVDLTAPDPELRLAALLAELDPTPARAASMAEALLTRLRYSNAERKHVIHLVQHPLPAPDQLASDPSLRRWLRRITPEQHLEACVLRRAHLRALGAAPSELDALSALQARATSELEKKPPLTLGALAIDGKRLMSDAGYKPGREIGTTLEALLELVLEDPSANEPEQLLAVARARRPHGT